MKKSFIVDIASGTRTRIKINVDEKNKTIMITKK